MQEGSAALGEALRRLAEVARPCGDLVALISHGYSHVQHHLDITLRRLHAAEVREEQLLEIPICC